MSKVFRLHSDGGTISDWGSTEPYGPGIINSISDPNEENDNINITSIPSPYARIELYKNAFEKVISGDLLGNSTYHKLVSQSLDVFQLFFNINHITNVSGVTISNWSFDTDFNELNNDQQSNKLLFDTLKMYFKADENSHNLNKVRNLFFLKMNEILVGSTAPNIMFMASPDIEKYRTQIGDINLQENHTLFSETHLPLYKRQYHFIKYFIDFFNNERAQRLFPLSYQYLQKNINHLQANDNDLFLQINGLDIEGNLEAINDPSGNGHIPVTIGGIELKKINQQGIASSDFFILSNKNTDNTIIVPSEHNGQHPESGNRLNFFNNMPWNSNNNGLHHDYSEDYLNRVLPGLPNRHPWLSKNDFFEDNLIELPYSADKDNFNILTIKSRSFFCPIKPIYFKFFDQNELNDAIEILETGNNITVSINIPTTYAGKIKLSKQYAPTKNETNINGLKAKVLSKNISVGLQNKYKFDKNVNKLKTLAYFDGIESNSIGLNEINYYDANGQKIDRGNVILDEEKKFDKTTEENEINLEIITHTVAEFTFIELNFGEFSSYLFPKLTDYTNGNNEYEIAIDFGTSNSYIAIKNINNDNNNIEELTIGQRNPLTIFTHKDFNENAGSYFKYLPNLINKYFMPLYISDNARDINGIPSSKLPFKSELLEIDNLNWEQKDFICGGDVAINYSNNEKYTKDIFDYFLDYHKIASNFKWFAGNNRIGKQQVNIYLNHLFIFIKHYLMSNNADLSKVKLIYTYPLSMSKGKLNQLKNIFADKMNSFFNINDPHDSIKGISESVSPYYYYQKYNLLDDYRRPTYNIDIGGGTVDIITYQGSKIYNQQSIRFGANQLFNYLDMPLSSNLNNFGILRWVKEDLKILFPDSSPNGLKVIEYLLEQEGEEFENAMKDPDHPFKFYFLVYFSAIFYYILKFNKLSKYEDIASITFSGSASKILKFLDNTPNYSTTRKYFDSLAKEFNQEQPLNNLHLHDSPKVITAKGALCVPFDRPFQMTDENDKFWLGNENDDLISLSANRLSNDFTFNKKNLEDSEQYETYSKELCNLFALIFKVLDNEEYQDLFYIKNIDKIHEKFMEEIQPSLTNFYAMGVNHQLENIFGEEETTIDETIFFAGFPSLFKELAIKLYEIKDHNTDE